MKRFLITGLSALVLAGTVAAGSYAGIIYGPRLAANEKTYDSNAVELTVTLRSHYRHVTPGATVTVTNCAGWHEGPLQVMDSPGFLPDGQELDIGHGKAVWYISKMPALPDYAQLDLLINLPKGYIGPRFCTQVQLRDRLTGKTKIVLIKLKLPLSVTAAE